MRVLILFFLVFSLEKSLAQNYTCINENRRLIFGTDPSSNGNFHIHFLQTDSVVISGSDATLYFSDNFIADNPGCFECYYGCLKGSFVAQRLVKRIGGVNVFFDQQGDSMKVHTNAPLGEENFLLNVSPSLYITAKLEKILFGEILGQYDSLKIYSLSVYDSTGTPINSGTNSDSLVLSKNFGLVRTFSIAEGYSISRLNLIGTTNPVLGIQDLTGFDIYNFEAGDEFHYSTYLGVRIINTRKIIVGKTPNADGTIEYLIDTLSLAVENYPPPYVNGVIWTFRDSVTLKVSNTTLSALPGSASDDGYVELDFVNGDFQKEVTRMDLADSCVSSILENCSCFQYQMESCYILYETFKAGLGRVYARQPGQSAYLVCGETVEDLVYYKKGNQQWGRPINFSSYVGLEPQRVSPKVAVTAGMEAIIVRFHFEQSQKVNVTIINLLGQEILSIQGDSSSGEMKIDNVFPPGIYFLDVKAANARYLFKLMNSGS